MPIRFQADADLNQVIVSGVVRRVPAIDFCTATSAGLAGLKDQEVLAVAPRDGRVLVTHDQATILDISASSCAHSAAPALSSSRNIFRLERRSYSHLDGDPSGIMDGSNRLPADLISTRPFNIAAAAFRPGKPSTARP